MEQFDIEKAKQILGDRNCTKELKCVNGGLENICKAEDVGVGVYHVCLEKDQHCEFSIRFRARFLCFCPVRIQLSKELQL